MHRTIVKWLFATYLLGSGTVWSILILPLFPFVGRGGRYWLAKQWCRAMVKMMRVITGVSCSVEGLENLPSEPFIMLCRHESTWETLAFMALFPRRISFVFKSEPVIVCLACQCPRGDTAVVIPADTTSTQRVASLGFSPLQ